MHLALVHIQNLRCLQDLRFKPGPRWNWLLGNNGQGKTSVLEGIFMLGTGNSFRDRGEGMIRLTATEMLVFGEIEGDGKHHRVGILRDRHTRTIKIDGQVVDSAWRLLEIMPILAMTADNSQILSDSPQQRRRCWTGACSTWNLVTASCCRVFAGHSDSAMPGSRAGPPATIPGTGPFSTLAWDWNSCDRITSQH